MLESDSSLLNNLKKNTDHFRGKMKNAGFEVLGNPKSAIVPILLKDAMLASKMADEMQNYGIYVIGFSYPVVPKGQARIRVQLSAAHSEEQIDKCVEAFITVGKKFKVLQNAGKL